jgi:peptide/nickel transport system ATP-binding protein
VTVTVAVSPEPEVLLDLQEVTKHFPVKGGAFAKRSEDRVRAVDGVSLQVSVGETLGLVGESGCGKSTLARLAGALLPATSGHILFKGQDLTALSKRGMRPLRRSVQMVFQDPYGSLNPRRRVGSILADPFSVHEHVTRSEVKRKVQDLMEVVGLSPEHYNRFPAEFSGGQRQRVGIARALALHPELIICDEPVSALDVSIQAQIINLLEDLQDEYKLTYLFIAHDLSVVRHVSDRIAVMYLGKLAEIGGVEEIYSASRHPYTASLLSAVPGPESATQRGEKKRIILTGDVPTPLRPPSGCRFHPRCPKAQERCAIEEPVLEQKPGDSPGHLTACHFPVMDGETLALASRPRPVSLSTPGGTP